MTHIYYGDPSEEFSVKLAQTLVAAGADILEIGVPYSDPVCDGEVFQMACKRALQNGITPFNVLEGIKKIRKKGHSQKIYLTSYYAPIFKIGIGKFIGLAKQVGVDGLIVPDILLEEQTELRGFCDIYGLSLIQFVTVYSDRERLRQICRASSDFIYCISLPGVTGENKLALSEVEGLIKLIKSMTSKSIYVGFGIKSAEDIKEIIQIGADGIIVGSAIARIYEKNIFQPESTLAEISAFVGKLKKGTIF
ncbi:tryptophan synthase subunit alpha [Candidatus Gottesmanbacteria bacterium]|nr:tryptophan synthase subunit alpha [Candidatus Gottesmanbacteria bacterium]